MTNPIPDLSRFQKPAPRISDELAEWTRTALAGPDEISWDIALDLIPTQQGAQPGFLVLLRMPSPVLGQSLTHLVLVDLPSLAEPVVTRHVRDAVEVLRKQRSALLAPLNGAGT